ncbi:sigma-54-dependent transcriptional regulator [Arhodomonas sp. SL1]|uniref:sigma-54-dependent transcriptional regulator n=1 Tax=Arhodomonas sp. SL1 TaxID=3425691 RepID=UPI003F881978
MSGDGARVLVVEDDAALAGLIVDELAEAGLAAESVASAEAARQRLATGGVDLVVSDLRLPGEDGMGLLERVRASEDGALVAFVAITAFGSIRQAVDALKRGADDFLTKPLDFDHLLVSVEKALAHRRLLRRVSEMEAAAREGSDFHGMIGRSDAMLSLFDVIRRIAAVGASVLITGESGTGKELVARALHAESGRSEGPFVAVNCAGVPADLLESEFFGHVRGAFTGAQRAREGLFRAADGGTLFLDEIGEMPAPLQAKLLRVLEDGRFRPVGAEHEEQVDVRVVAATNADLEAAVADGTFREDLFYRLETFRIEVPPLRERGDDLDLLTARFAARFAGALGRDTPELAPEVVALLARYPFPGNVRELANTMERAVTLSRDGRIRREDLPPRLLRHAGRDSGEGESGPAILRPLAEVEREHVRAVMQAVGGNKRRAAEILGIGRQTLYRKLEGSPAD